MLKRTEVTQSLHIDKNDAPQSAQLRQLWKLSEVPK